MAVEPTTLTRRNALRAGVWTVPVVALVAPAPSFALSSEPCAQYPVDFEAYQRIESAPDNRERHGVVTVQSSDGGAPVTIDVVSQSYGDNELLTGFPGAPDDQTPTFVQSSTSSGFDTVGLALGDRYNTYGYDNRSTTTLTFSTPVTELAFTVTNLDANDGHSDTIAVLPAGYAFDIMSEQYALHGSGTVDDPFVPGVRYPSFTGQYDAAVAVSYGSQQVQTVLIHHWNSNTDPNNAALVFLIGMTFRTC